MTGPVTERAAGPPLIVVGVGDMRASDAPGAALITYALGSCLGLAVHDAAAGVGGLLHLMLPTAELDPAKAQANPHMFCDTGVPSLFRACYALGARKERMVVKVAGGAATGDGADHFQIGKRNVLTLRKLLWKNGVLLRGEEVGGHGVPRTMRLDVGTGVVTLTTHGASRVL